MWERLQQYIISAWSPVYWVVRIPTVLACLLLWGLSLFLPCVEWGINSGVAWVGAAMLALGWLGPLIGHVAWFAHIPWVVALGLVVVGADTLATGVGLLASILALSAIATLHLVDPNGWALHHPHSLPFRAFGVGFWLWTASMCLPLVSSALLVGLRVIVTAVRGPEA